jgi:autotransporter-associated beta strand protein
MAIPSPQLLRSVSFACVTGGFVLSIPLAGAAWAPVPVLSNSPAKSQFLSHELYFSDSSYEVPYYLKHFAQVANAVVETGFNRVETNGTSPTIVTNYYPPGFLDIRVNRDTRDNRPYNARIMEMQSALAYFYTADRPWNVYRGHAAVKIRLEEMLKRWVLMQNSDGLFAEYSAANWSLAPTGFGVMAAAQALDLLKDSGQPFDATVLENARLALRKALMALFTRSDMQNAASSYSNQYSGSYHAALIYLENWPDAELNTAFVAAVNAASATDQSPTGYFYEANGPDFDYSNVHERNLRIGLTRLRTRTNDLLPVIVTDENRWAAWLGANLVLQPNISTPTFLANAGINTRTSSAFQTPESRPLSEFAPLSRAFCYTGAEFTNAVRAKTDSLASTPTYGTLTTNNNSSYIPMFVFEALGRTEAWHPTAAQRTEAVNSLPYLASERFNRVLHNGTSGKLLTVAAARRPSYYGLFNTGEAKADQVKFGLGLLWNPVFGTALQALAGGINNSLATSWGTSRTDMTRVYEQRGGGQTLGAVLRLNGSTFGMTNGTNNLADGILSATYNLFDGATNRGSKTVTFEEDRIRVDVTHANAFTERLPLIAPSSASRTTNATQLTLTHTNGSRLIMRLLSGGNFTVAGAATDNLPSALRRHAVTINATNSLSYELFVTSDAFQAGALGAPTAESYAPANSGADVGETVTYNLPLVNLLGASTSASFNATLQASGGVVPVTTNQVYGAVAVGATVSKPFLFSVNGNFGDPLTITLALRDGTNNYGNISYQTFIGGLSTNTTTTDWQNFDGVSAPALPGGWTSSVPAGTAGGWTTTTNSPNTAPNSVSAVPTGLVSEQRLDSPSFNIPAAAGDPELRFQHRWDTENTYDGGVLEISVDGGDYADIVSAGGSFVAGGYSGALSSAHQNPLGGRQAWFGSSNSAYTLTRISLPSSMLGKSLRLRFRLGSDSSVTVNNAVWRIDTLQLVYKSPNNIQPAEITSAAPAGSVPLGIAYSHTFVALGQPAPVFAVTAGTLPAGMTLSPSGVLSGTVGSNFSARSITVAATNGVTPIRSNATQTFTLQPLVALAISTTSLNAATVGAVYSASLAATGGSLAHSWTLASGSLPAGLVISQAGIISGTPLSAGTANFSVRVTDALGASVTKSLSIIATNPAALSVVTPSLPDGLAGAIYSVTLAAVSGTGPCTWSLASGVLPAGLSLSAGGIVGGTPSASGSSTFTVRVTDSAAATATRSFTVSVSGTLGISTASLPDVRTGTVYSATLGVTDGTGPFTWTTASGTLPPGLTLNSAGVISGTATGLGSFIFVARVTDANSAVAEREYTLHAVNTLTWDAQPATAGIQTGNGTWTTATNSTNWSISNSNVAWVNGSDAIIGGGTLTVATPLTVGGVTFNTNVVINGSSLITIKQGSVITANGADSTIAAPLSGTSFTKEGASRLILSNAGYSGDVNIAAGELRLNEPAGERMWNGTISGSGAILTLGPGRIVLGGANTFTGQFTLTGQSVIRLADGSALGATSGNTRLNGDSNNAPGIELVDGITVPEPFQLIMWTPSVINTNTNHAQIRNVTGRNELTGQIGLDAGGGRWDIASDEGHLKVSGPVVNIAQRTSSNADSWRTLHLRGPGSGEFTGPMTDATNGFSKVNVNVLSGTWILGGTNKTYTGSTTIAGGTLQVDTTIASEIQLPGGTLGGAGRTTSNLVVGAGATVVRRLTDWALPGPAFTAAQVRGTNNPVWTVRLDAADLANFSETAKTVPVLAASNGLTGLALSNITLQADDFPGHGTWSLATNTTGLVAIYDPDELTVPAQVLPSAERGAVYNFQLVASGGVQPREWAVVAGALPSGMQLTSFGLLSGTPSVAGSFAFTVQVTDAADLTASRAFVFAVDEAPLEIVSATLQDAAVGEYHTETLAVTGGSAPYLWSVVAGTLPPGLVMGSDGELAGTPSAAGRFNFTALAADDSGSTAQRSLAINVSAAPGSFEEWSGGVRWPDQASAAKSADPDGDGLSNLLEFAFATDPLAAGARWPVVDLLDSGAGQTSLRLRFRRSATATGLRFTVEVTSGLAAPVWEAVAEAEPGGPMTGLSPRILVEEQPLPDGASAVVVTETRIPGEGSRFMRLQVAEELP